MRTPDSETCFNKWPPRVVIAAPQGRSGKTVVSIGLCAAFKQRGLAVQPFKRGPDYIDPSWLTAAAGRGCRNLDDVLFPEETLLASFQRASRGADLVIIEGAHGLYDSLDDTGRGSTARLSRLLHSPVILVVNTSRMTRSAAAMVTGYQRFEPETNIAGVILNNVSGSRHEDKLVAAIEQYCGIPVVGSIPRDSNLAINERHLGLVPYPELDEPSDIDRIRLCLEKHLNLDSILDIARRASDKSMSNVPLPVDKAALVRIGVMRDCVFTFYYPENLEALEQAGAELVFIDSIHDGKLPDIDALYIGGGFPELFLPELAANGGLRHDIARAIENDLPVYAECAGLMYLCDSISWRGDRYDMVGVIPAAVELCPKPQGHGYVMVEVTGENPLFPIGLTFWGHEFHHSRLSESNGLKFAYHMLRGRGVDGSADGIVYKNVFAAYTHVHALGVPRWAEAFCKLALSARKEMVHAKN